jgi:hypothetical protein
LSVSFNRATDDQHERADDEHGTVGPFRLNYDESSGSLEGTKASGRNDAENKKPEANQRNRKEPAVHGGGRLALGRAKHQRAFCCALPIRRSFPAFWFLNQILFLKSWKILKPESRE